MAGQGISGKDGDVKIGPTSICEIRKWSFNPKSNNPSYASNKTSGYKRRVPGVKDGSGSLEGAWDPANPAVAVIDAGTEVTLLLYINATQNYSVPSVIDSFQLDVDVDEGEIVSWTADYSTNGAWTNPSAALTAPAGFDTPGDLPGGEDNWEFMPQGQVTTEGQPEQAPVVDDPAATQTSHGNTFEALVEAVTNRLEMTLDQRLRNLTQPTPSADDPWAEEESALESAPVVAG